MKKIIGSWLQWLGLMLTENSFYTIPTASIVEYDFTKCQCGHSMHDHQPDPDGHGTICLVCYSLMRHKPQAENILEETILEI
jgi:hypothetical protein